MRIWTPLSNVGDATIACKSAVPAGTLAGSTGTPAHPETASHDNRPTSS